MVPHLMPGSGGHRTIFTHVRHLVERGWECTLYVADPPGAAVAGSAHEMEAQIGSGFFPTGARIVAGWDRIDRCDVLFATVWYSARVVRDHAEVGCRAYFVQDFEPWFSPMGDGYLLAEATYRFGLPTCTIGRWLTHVLASRYGAQAAFCDFSVDDTVYASGAGGARDRAVAFVFQPDKARRCPAIGLEALRHLKRRRPDVTVYLYGSAAATGHLEFEHVNLGLLTPAACAALYRRVQVGLCLSASNPSRVPFEMMACGAAVVELDRENNRFDFAPDAVTLAGSDPDALADALVRLLDDDVGRSRQVAAGLRLAAKRTAASALSQFERMVESLCEHRALTAATPTP